MVQTAPARSEARSPDGPEPSAAWLPMASAPKDGTVVLGWVVHGGDEITGAEPFERPSLIYWDEGCANPGWERPAGWEKQWVGEVRWWQPIVPPHKWHETYEPGSCPGHVCALCGEHGATDPAEMPW